MRRLIFLFCLMLPLVGCEKDNVATRFNVSTTNVELGQEATTFTIEFNNLSALTAPPTIHIEYGIKDNEHFDYLAEWITIEHYDENGATFSVESNTWPSKRYATIRVKNEKFSDFTDIKVSQEWFGRKLVDINISNVTTCSFDANVVSDDDSIFVIVDCLNASKGYTAEYYEYQCMVSAQWRAENMMNSFIREAEKLGVDVIDMIREQNYGGNGDFTRHYDLCRADQRWVAYAVGVKLTKLEDGRYDVIAVTPMVYAIADIDYPAYRSDIDFNTEISVDSHFGSDVDIAINPTNWDGLYYYVMIEGHDFTVIWSDNNLSDPKNLFIYFSDYWNMSYYSKIRSQGLTIEDAYEIYDLDRGASNGRFSLSAYTDYVLLTFALDDVDGVLQIVSVPQVNKFSTRGLDSDISFEYTINSTKPRRVNYTITPSLDNEGYYSTIISKEEYESWNEELLYQHLVDEGTKSGIYFGPQDIEMYTSPDTEYYILFVGVYGGVATTDEIVKFEFTTPTEPEPMCKIIDVDILGPYHTEALLDYDAEKYGRLHDWSLAHFRGYCNVATDLHYEGEPENIYSFFIADEQVEGLNREQIITMVRDCKYEAKALFFVKRDVTFHYYAMVEDEDGNIDLYISPEEYYFTEDKYLTSEEDIARLAALYDEILALEEEKEPTSPTPSATRTLQPEALCIAECPINL